MTTVAAHRVAPLPAPSTAQASLVTTDWRKSLPILASASFSLRELRLSDAPSLLAMLATEDVSRFISPPPSTQDGFERFILWTQRERAAGSYICYGIVPEGYDAAVGLFQLRQLEPGFKTAEWGFAIGSHFWGSGLFAGAALLILDFAFDTVGIDRLEARAAVQNGRGNGALKKLGATHDGVLHKSFLRDGEYLDQNLWVLDAADWETARLRPGATVN